MTADPNCLGGPHYREVATSYLSCDGEWPIEDKSSQPQHPQVTNPIIPRSDLQLPPCMGGAEATLKSLYVFGEEAMDGKA